MLFTTPAPVSRHWGGCQRTATHPGPSWAPKGQGQPSACPGSGRHALSPARDKEQSVV